MRPPLSLDRRVLERLSGLRELALGVLTIIHKAGKPKDDPNNYRGINLMDVILTVRSRILNKKLFKLLDKHATKFQFGGTPGVGCREGIFTLKTAIHTR